MDSKKTGKKISLSYLIGISVFFVVIVPIAVVGVFTGILARNALVEQAYDFSLQLLDNKSHQINEQNNTAKSSLERFTTDYSIQQYAISKIGDTTSEISDEKISELLSKIRDDHKLENLDVILQNRVIISTREDVESKNIFTSDVIEDLEIQAKSQLSDAVVVTDQISGEIPEGYKTQYILKAILANGSGEYLGFIVVSYPYQLSEIQDHPNEDFPHKFEYLLLADNGEILNKDYPKGFPANVQDKILESANPSGYLTQFVDGQNRLFAYQKLEGENWVIISNTPLENYDQYISRISWNFFLIFILIITFSLLAAWLVVVFILMPFNRVIHSFQAIKNGTFDWKTHLPGSFIAELDSLTHWFNSFVETEQSHRQMQTDLSDSERRYHSLFDNSPIPLWEEDFSEVLVAIDELNLTLPELESYLIQKPDEVIRLISKLKIMDVNKASLQQYKAVNKEQVLRHSSVIFKNVNINHVRMEILEMAKKTMVYELELENNTYAGEVLMIRMRWSVFPGYEASMGRVIVSTLDITSEMKENLLKSTTMQIAQEASRVETLQELYRSIHWALAKIMPADNLFIALYDEEKGMVSFPYFVDQFDEAPEPRVFSNGWTEHVIRTGKPVLISPDYVRSFEDENGLDTVGTESIDWLGVPLIVKDRTIGAIVVQTYEDGTRYTQEHADWLIIASTQIAMAIDRKQAEEALKYSSTHDKLTGLYNRAYFEAELSRLSAGRQNPVGVIMLDVDGLKTTNDTYGHIAGDELLRRTANVLLKAFRSNDMVARIGGDEFVILLPQSDLLVVQKAVERIEKALAENNSKRNRAKLSLSIGICCTREGININDAIKIADQEMYAIKSLRKQNAQK